MLLGISRMAVSKHVAGLVAAGFSVEAVRGVGYRLLDEPDAPVPAAVELLLTEGPFELHGGGDTGSTNDDARLLARKGAAEFTVCMASSQRTGRGRLGRTWASGPGGVYLSVVLRPAVAPADLPSLSLAMALAVSRALRGRGADTRVKWPNDVYVDTGKVAGISLEMSAEVDRVAYVVVGIGVNVSRHPDTHAGAGCLSDVVTAVPRRAEVAASVLDELHRAYRIWSSEGFEPFESEFRDAHLLDGEQVTVRDAFGTVLATGTVSGVDAHGRLMLEGEGNTALVSSGEVTLRD